MQQVRLDDMYCSNNTNNTPRNINHRSLAGCWTCKLRRKKCDGNPGVCEACASLGITCHYDLERPEWMDGRLQQEAMAQGIRRQVKEYAHDRPARRNRHTSNGQSHVKPPVESHHPGVHRGHACAASKGNVLVERSDTLLVLFYLESVFPFLYPFYDPPIFEGGKFWILEMMIHRPVVRQAILCQSSYFFSLAQSAGNKIRLWDDVLLQTRDAFEVLRSALAMIGNSDVADHLSGTVRVLTSIVQVQRFEIVVASFDNCQAHLSAALALFR